MDTVRCITHHVEGTHQAASKDFAAQIDETLYEQMLKEVLKPLNPAFSRRVL